MSEAQAANYACAAISLFIVLFRAITTIWQRKKLDTSFYLVLASIVFIIARIVVNHYYLSFGTVSDVLSGKLTVYDPDLVRAGSILVLIARIILAVILWLQMCILLLFYQNLLSGITVVAFIIRATWFMLAATFVGTILATLLECRPIELYWQMDPRPGQCVRAYAQLLLQGISNGIVDIMLLVISFPILSLQKRTLGEHLRLYGLFVLGTFCIVVTILRVVLIFNNSSSQETRSLWASIQVVVSTFVANAPNVYGSLRVARRRKSSAGGPGTTTATEMPTRRQQPSSPAGGLGGGLRPGMMGRDTMSSPSPDPTESWLKMDDVELAMNAMMMAPGAYHDQQYVRGGRQGSLDLDIDPHPPRPRSPSKYSGRSAAAAAAVAAAGGDDPTARHSYPSSSSFSVTNPHHEHRQSTST
ncbi:hypothetical protein Micbo1qcDRAFT_165229 [Microdochium bolleyi]|uniref:Rhodopsin domain-containing protein n=1 Tax=Microdochium bolleyi TaxID=196109 RepID=A0A136IY94_9PEZI|nr:hypothetical protein Micbo1qcDRAFT_165229 [Microdochium bolleyi]